MNHVDGQQYFRSGHSSGDSTVVGEGQSLSDYKKIEEFFFIYTRVSLGNVLKEMSLFVTLSVVYNLNHSRIDYLGVSKVLFTISLQLLLFKVLFIAKA